MPYKDLLKIRVWSIYRNKEAEKSAKDSLINLAIELAVNYLKGLKK